MSEQERIERVKRLAGGYVVTSTLDPGIPLTSEPLHLTHEGTPGPVKYLGMISGDPFVTHHDDPLDASAWTAPQAGQVSVDMKITDVDQYLLALLMHNKTWTLPCDPWLATTPRRPRMKHRARRRRLGYTRTGRRR